jgi:hypothetical protein
MQDETYVDVEGTKIKLTSFSGSGGEDVFEVPVMTSDLTQDGDEDNFPYLSMKDDDDKVDFSSQRPPHRKQINQFIPIPQKISKSSKIDVKTVFKAKNEFTKATRKKNKKSYEAIMNHSPHLTTVFLSFFKPLVIAHGSLVYG